MKRREMLIGAAVTGAAGVATIAAVTQSTQALAQAAAPAAGGTLDRIIKDKKIRVTAEVTSPPFGILDKDNKPDGSEIETARQLAKDLGVELELVQVTARSAFPRCSPGAPTSRSRRLSITFDRAKTVMFAPPHGALSIVIAGPKKTPHQERRRHGRQEDRPHARDARGSERSPALRRPAPRSSSSTTSPRRCRRWSPARSTRPACRRSPRSRSPTAIRARRSRTSSPCAPPTTAPAVRPGDFDLLQFLRTWVFLNKQNGVLAKIYKKYTGVPLVDLPVL